MQTDTWLTGMPYPENCPLCSQLLTRDSNICPACGFIAHESAQNPPSLPGQTPTPRSSRQINPITPIPARASARRGQSSPGLVMRHALMNSDFTGFASEDRAEHQSEGQQYNSPNFEAASSLNSLSLIIAEIPTAPIRTTQRLAHSLEEPQHIDEIDTVPSAFTGSQPALQLELEQPEVSIAPGSVSLFLDKAGELPLLRAHAVLPGLIEIDEIDTLPERSDNVSAVLPEVREAQLDASSWTAGTETTPAAQSFAVSTQLQKLQPARGFHPLDRLRWWLLRPGHMEFSLWLVGSILLFGITFLLLLATVLSTMPSGQTASGNFPTSTTKNAATVSTVVPATSTLGSTPTPIPSPTSSSTVEASTATATAGQGSNPNSGLHGQQNTSVWASLTRLNPLIWLIVVCYFLSMALLGTAVILRRKRR